MKADQNDRCPCGSGRAYKDCCEPKDGPGPQAGDTAKQRKLGALAVVLVLAAIPLLIVSARSGGSGGDEQAASEAARFEQRAPAEPPAAPEPWHYDAERDQHYHPVHEHWHAGPPPEGAQEAENPAAFVEPAPEPWFHDQENDRHWDPRAGHGHWHRGAPPPPEQRR